MMKNMLAMSKTQTITNLLSVIQRWIRVMPALFFYKKKALMVAWVISYTDQTLIWGIGYSVSNPKNLQQERRICQAIFNQKQNGKKAQSQNINQYRPYLLVPNTNKSLGIFWT